MTPPTLTCARMAAADLHLRPWEAADAEALVDIWCDPAPRRWTAAVINDLAAATRWIEEQRRGWETGHRLAFAVG